MPGKITRAPVSALPGTALRRLARHELPASAGAVPGSAATVPRARAEPAHRCELCSEPLPEQHKHLLELTERDIRCACRACAVLFDRKEAAGGRYRTVPRLRTPLPGLRIDDVLWAGLRVPVRLAFFVRHDTEFAHPAVPGPAGPPATAHYPSPLGVISAAVEEEAWRRIERANPVLADMDTDVVGLLIHRDTAEHWLVGIDDCYRLTARVRDTWSGMTGGDEVWREIEAFFAGLRAEARPPSSSASPT